MRITIAIKIFGIAVGLLILMTVVALLNMRMTRTVDDQLVIIDRNYFPAYVALAQATSADQDAPATEKSHRNTTCHSGNAARQHINKQIGDRINFNDSIALARLDVRIESLQEERQQYEAVLAKLLTAAQINDKAQASQLLAQLDNLRGGLLISILSFRNGTSS